MRVNKIEMSYLLLSAIAVLVVISMAPAVLSESTDAGLHNPEKIISPGDFTVPSWIKNNAGWWAAGQIDDGSFVSGIQWLILNDVITIPSTEQGASDGDNVIPSWVKNTAGWWAEDKIHDITFVAGIKYLINEGIMIVGQVEQAEEVEECTFKGIVVTCPAKKVVEEINDFYMEVNSGSCTTCVNWTYVGQNYNFQIETYDEKRGSYIDGVKINVKIISKGGELRHNFGEVTTEDGIYKGIITIPSLDWYAENILSVTGEYNDVKKTIEKEFSVFAERSYSNINSLDAVQNSGGTCTEVSPLEVDNKDGWPGYTFTAGETSANGLAFSEDGNKMFVVGKDNDVVSEYILGGSFTNSTGTFSFTGPYCLGKAHKLSAYNIGSQTSGATGIEFSNNGTRMFILGEGGNDKVYEYKLTEKYMTNSTAKHHSGPGGVAAFVDAFDVSSQDNAPQGIAFSTDGLKMFIVGDQNDSVFQYTLSEHFDISTASFASKSFDIDGASNDIENAPQGIAFSTDGLKMFIVGKENKKVYEFNLAESFDLGTVSYASADDFIISSEETKPREIAFDYSGKYMFILGTQGNDVTVYKLSEHFDVSTAEVQSG